MPTVLLADRGVIEVKGPDAADFLNRLLTNQVPDQPAPLASHAALLTPQGKILATLFIIRHPVAEDGFLLDCARACLPDTLKRLALYKLRAACTITDVSDQWHVSAHWPAQDAPESADVIRVHDPRDPAMGTRLLSRTPPQTQDDMALYESHRITLGLAEDGKDFEPNTVFPHEINLDHSHGLDFHKGCYIGQEVVSRMQHRGTARNRIVVIGFQPDTPPPAGCEVRAGGTLLGQITSVDPHGHGLALLRLDRVADAHNNAQPLTADGHPLTVALPDWIKHA